MGSGKRSDNIDHDVDTGAAPADRDGLASMAILVLTVVLIVFLITRIV